MSLPAVVLHDTGASRGGMTECYHGPCDIYNHREQHKNNINWDFLLSTTQTIIGKFQLLKHINLFFTFILQIR